MLILAFLPLLACASEEPDEETREATDAFTGAVGVSVSWPYNPIKTEDLSPSTGWTGFLSGASGNLAKPASTVPNFWAVAGVVAGQGSFTVQAIAGAETSTNGATGWAAYHGGPQQNYNACSHTGPGSGSVILAAPSGNYACFLVKILNTNSLAFGSWNDKAIITYPGGVPTLTCHEDASAWARCLPITTYLGSVTAGSANSATSTNLGPVDWSNGKLCGLVGLNGSFRSNSLSSGVSAYISGSSWYFDTTAGKGGTVACVQ